MPFDLVIFDCDGVLIDSEPIVNRVHAEMLAACGYPIGEAELLDRFCGMSDKDMLAAIESEWGRALPADYEQRAAAVVAREYRRGLKAIDGVAALPVPVCVASSGMLGIAAAVAAGMTAIGFTGGGHCRPGHDSRLLAEGARLVIDRMAQLLPILARHQP